MDNFRIIRTSSLDKYNGGERNFIPDFLGVSYDVKLVNGVPIPHSPKLSSFYELKATKRDLRPSSFNYQVQAEILFLGKSSSSKNMKEMIVVTTHGIKLSKNLYKLAKDNNVKLTHQAALYKIGSNGMELKFEHIDEKQE